MHHIIYKSQLPSGKYYIGRHSTEKLDDGYKGSGKWIRSLKSSTKNKLVTTIIDKCNSFDELLILEEIWISKFLDDIFCMNWNNKSIGFATGSRNPNTSIENRQKIKERMMGSGNPMYKKSHTQESKDKISLATKGSKNPFYGKNHTKASIEKISEKRKSFRYSDEQKKQISINRKLDYESGKRIPAKGFLGKKHDKNTLDKMSEAHKNRKRIICIHCGISCASNTYARWHGDKCKNRIKQ